MFQSQYCVPQVITFDQDKDELVRQLKQQYENIADIKEQQKKKGRIEGKKSYHAQCFKNHVAAEAEPVVQTKIYEAARREGAHGRPQGDKGCPGPRISQQCSSHNFCITLMLRHKLSVLTFIPNNRETNSWFYEFIFII